MLDTEGPHFIELRIEPASDAIWGVDRVQPDLADFHFNRMGIEARALREKLAIEDAKAQTAVGIAERNIESLFNAYKTAVEKQSGKSANLDFTAFRDNLIHRAADFREKHAGKKLTFKIVMKDGKVTMQAQVKE